MSGCGCGGDKKGLDWDELERTLREIEEEAPIEVTEEFERVEKKENVEVDR